MTLQNRLCVSAIHQRKKETAMLFSRPLLRNTLIVLALACVAGAANAQTSLNAELNPYLAKHELPALAAAVVKDSKIKAFLAGPDGDNPPIIGPACIAHISVLDFAMVVVTNISDKNANKALFALAPELYKKFAMRRKAAA